jgi:hypothetical protein
MYSERNPKLEKMMQQVEHQSFDNKEILNKLKKLELKIETEDLVYEANPNNYSGFFRGGI